jgi:hypothetical protein
MKTTKTKTTFAAWLKERVRKFFVALKKNPQSIPIVALVVTFLHYSLNLTSISNTTAKLQGRHMGLAAFVTMLFLILSFVCMINAFPKRQKPKIAMIVIMIVLYAAVIFADIHYLGRIVYAISRPDNPIKITSNTAYIAIAYNTVIINIVLVAVTTICMILEPVIAKLVKKINTSIDVEGSGDIASIDIADEE